VQSTAAPLLNEFVYLRRFGYCVTCDSLKNISPAHNADDFSMINDRNAFDPVLIEQADQLVEPHFWARGDRRLGHYIGGLNAVRLQEIASLEVNQIGFTDNPDERPILIHHRHCADLVVDQDPRDICNGRVESNNDDASSHNIGSFHWMLPFVFAALARNAIILLHTNQYEALTKINNCAAGSPANLHIAAAISL
jgi:hypothetical protein